MRMYGSVIAILCGMLHSFQAQAELESWKHKSPKKAITEFVTSISNPESPDFVPQSDRIAVLDNDGTLWAEKPFYFQGLFALDRVKALAQEYPHMKENPTYKNILEKGLDALHDMNQEQLLQLILDTHGNMDIAEFEQIANNFLNTQMHPTKKRLYKDLVYKPMVELIDYLHEHQFNVWIISGGGQGFIRAFAQEAYNIPRHNVVGSQFKYTYVANETGKAKIVRDPIIFSINDHEGKPINIQRFVGQRPILAVGNSDGDYEMLQWTTQGDGPRLGALIHHTDSKREWSYDKKSIVGRLDKGLKDAKEHGWIIVDMKHDWKTVFTSD